MTESSTSHHESSEGSSWNYDDGGMFDEAADEKASVGSTESMDVDIDRECTKEFFELLKEGFSTFPAEVHKDRQPIEVEPTLWALFKGAYGCIGDEVTAEDVSDWLDDLRDSLKLTKSAQQEWNTEKRRYRKEENNSPGMLVLLLKHWHPEFANGKLKEYYKKQRPTEYATAQEAFECTLQDFCMKHHNCSDCFEAGRDTLRIRWYVDGAGDLRADDTHELTLFLHDAAANAHPHRDLFCQ